MSTKPKYHVLLFIALACVSGCKQEAPKASDQTVAPAASKPDKLFASTATPAVDIRPATPVKPVAAPKPVVPVDSQAVDEPKPPESDDESPAFAPELQPRDGLSIRRLVTAPAVQHREPVAASSMFGSHEEKVYAFVEAQNESDEPKKLIVHFIGPDDSVTGGIELEVPAKSTRWRTWAFTKHAKAPGLWRVEVRTPDGELVGALPFEVDHGC